MAVAVFPVVAVIFIALLVASGAVAVIFILIILLILLLKYRKRLVKSDEVVKPLQFSRLMSQTSNTSEQQQTPTDGNGRTIGTGQEKSHDRD